MAPCVVDVIFFVLLVQTIWAQPAEWKDVAQKPLPEVSLKNNEKVRETEIEEPIDEEILNQFKKHAIANSKVLLELGKQQLRLLGYLSGRKSGGDLLFGNIEDEIQNLLPIAPGGSSMSESSTNEELTLSTPPHEIGSSILAQITGNKKPLVSQQAVLPVPALAQNTGNQVPSVSQQAAQPVPALAQNTGNQVPSVSQQAAQPVPALAQNTGNQVPSVSQQAAQPVPALAQNTGNQVPSVSQQAAQPVPALAQNTGNQVPSVSQQAAQPVPALAQNTGNQVPSVSQQAAQPVPALAQNTGNQVSSVISASGPSPSTNTSPDVMPPNGPVLNQGSYTSAAPTSNLKPLPKPLNPLSGDMFHHSYDFITLPKLKPVNI